MLILVIENRKIKNGGRTRLKTYKISQVRQKHYDLNLTAQHFVWMENNKCLKLECYFSF